MQPIFMGSCTLDDHSKTFKQISKECTTANDALQIFSQFPWEQFEKICEESGEGPGIYFRFGDSKPICIELQIIPIDQEISLAMLDIQLEKRFLGLFGGKVIRKDLGEMKQTEIKQIIEELFRSTPEQLFTSYQSFRLVKK